MLKLIVSGTRTYKKPAKIRPLCAEAVDLFRRSIFEEVWIGQGESGAVDLVAKRAAKDAGYKGKSFPADWSYGLKAGPIRNKKMARWGNALLAIWDGKSRGTKNMIDEARKAGIPENRIIIYSYGQVRKRDKKKVWT